MVRHWRPASTAEWQRGLFGRLKLKGHLPTSNTDPQPMGKVGRVFYPKQDRIVSVRECAWAQVQCWTLHALQQSLEKTFRDYPSDFCPINKAEKPPTKAAHLVVNSILCACSIIAIVQASQLQAVQDQQTSELACFLWPSNAMCRPLTEWHLLHQNNSLCQCSALLDAVHGLYNKQH